MHEAKQHEHNCWITLTYDDKHLPFKYYTGIVHPRTGKKIYSGSLDKTHVQKFYRRTRKALGRINTMDNDRILFSHYTHTADMGLRPIPLLRYYYGGEYGEKYNRPHYHVCLFGIDFRDKKLIETSREGFKYYESATLAKLWTAGRHTLTALSWETAAYTARYIMKKITGEKQKEHYKKIDIETGEIINVQPEFNDMSRRPGIGHHWLHKWHKDVYKQETSSVRVRGNLTQPPRYYDKQYKKLNRDHYEHLKRNRYLDALQNWENQTTERLLAEEIITTRKIQTLKQKL